MPQWYLLYTKPKNEDIVTRSFLDAGLEVLNPKLKERKVYRRRLQDVISPLFPCYLFVRFDFEQYYKMVKYTRGVRSIVGATGHPNIVPENIINLLQQRVIEGYVTIKTGNFKQGDRVEIVAGPFEGFDAVFEKELKGSERVSILLGAISARTHIDKALLIKKG